MGEKTKRLLSILIVVCMVVMSVVNVQEIRVSADESVNEPVTYEYYDEFGNSVVGTRSDYSVVSNVATGAAIGVASGSAIGVVSGSAISVVSGGAISVVTGGAICVSGGAICVSGGAISCATGGAVTWGGDEQQWYVVEGNITVEERIMVTTGAAVNLILKNGSKLTANKGINVPEGSTLNIFGQGAGDSAAGQLIATGDTYCAGIGGGYGESGGTVVINGGSVISTGGYGAAGIGAGMNGATGELNLSVGMSAFASDSGNYGYTPLTSGTTGNRRYVVAYRKYSGIMSASGNTITATYIDAMGAKSNVSMSITALTAEEYIGSQVKIVSLENLDSFNSALGKSGDYAVSEAQIRHFTGDGEPLDAAPTTQGDYIAEITVDGVTARLNYHTDVNPMVEYEFYLDYYDEWVARTCTDYSVVSSETVNWCASDDTPGWYIVQGDVHISDLVTVTGRVNLILLNDSVLTVDKGINVTYGNELWIYRQKAGSGNMGRLSAYGEYGQAGIGGGEGQTLGKIEIYGGNIYAYGGSDAAGIGSGKDGVITSVPYDNGSWFLMYCGYVYIIGGEVTAYGGYRETNGGSVNTSVYGDAIGEGVNAASIDVYIRTGMKAFYSDNDWMYSPITRGSANRGRSALVYPAGSGVMSAYGNTLYATFVDEYGYRSSARLALMEPIEVYDLDETKKATLEDADYFNTALGRTGGNIVSESQIRYYDRDGREYSYAPTWHGNFTAKITVDSVELIVNYDIDYVNVRSTETIWDGNTHQCYVADSSESFYERIQVYGTVNLYLSRGSLIRANKGIHVGWGSTLNIYSEEDNRDMNTGKLIAQGSDYQAGIGGDYYEDGGTIVIYGGEVEATGGCYAAGIGGGYGGYGGTITINGGNVTAEGGIQGAGIGGGRYWGNDGDGYSYGGNITINGGNVTASAGDGASGIGGGRGCSAGTVRITGGIVHATGHEAGIGGGAFGPGGDITITGGSIVAEGATNYAGIGINTNRYRGIINIASDVKAFSSLDDTVYTQFYREGSNIGRYVLVYKENSGVMSASGNTVTATYIDQNGSKQSVSTSIAAPSGVIYGEPEDILPVLVNKDAFNATLGKIGDNAVSESQIVYFRYAGSKLQAAPEVTGVYIAELTIDDAKAVLQYEPVLNPNVTYGYFDNNRNPVDGSCGEYGVVKSNTVTLDGDLHEWYVAAGNLYLGDRLNVSGSVNLVLMDGAVLTASKGINVASGSALAIFGQDHESENPGYLYAYGDYECAGIGSSAHENAGSITINGCVITANGGSSGAGIGGGSYGNGGITTINGGRVTATGGSYGAGIGGGDWYTDAGNIIINGGKINATGSSTASGIGGGWEGTGGNISINGGQIVATAGYEYAGAGIGGGSSHETICNISVGDGMKVYASASQNSGYTAVTTGNTPGGRYALAYNEHSGIVSASGNTITATYVDENYNRSNVSLVLTPPANKLYRIKEDALPSLTGLDSFNSALNKTGMHAVMKYQIRYFKPDGEALQPEPTRVGSYMAKITVDGATAVLYYDVTEPEYITVTGNDTTWVGTPDDCFVVRGYFTNNHRITVSGTVNLVLLGGSELKALKGITVTEGNTLNIYGEGVDFSALIATGESNQAGIGGGDHQNAGTINIYGGKVIATGGYSGAGIGGGSYGSGGNVNVYGGLVNATGGTYGAGIGGGDWYGTGGNVTINGGKVFANGGDYGGAGIGGGWQGAGGNFTINGGRVTATGNSTGAGIGGGVGCPGGIITINGGGMIATGGEYGGAGIGAGQMYDPDNTIVGGTLALNNGMMALTSLTEDTGYTEIPSGNTDNKRYAIVYKRNGGLLSTSGREITALYIDETTSKNTVSILLELPGGMIAPGVISFDSTITNRVAFNTALGRTGENEVTGKNIRYYSGVGEEFTKGNRKASMARLFVDDVMVYIEYIFFGG